MTSRRAGNSRPRRALGPAVARPGRARRAVPRYAVSGQAGAGWSGVAAILVRCLAVAFLAITGGGLTYAALPVPSVAAPAAEPLLASEVVAPPPVAPAPAGLVGGLIEGDDLLTDPPGVQTATPALVDGELIGWPVTDHTPSSGFGYRTDPFTHLQRWHDGVDLGQPCGDAVRASLDGVVAYAGWAGGYGYRVIVRHADRADLGFATAYSHLSRIDVRVGQPVARGEAVGAVGSTGRSTACHLHFEVILGSSYVDPMRFLTGDRSKADLSRRVGSYMPSGLPSPSPTTSRRTTPTPRPASATPTPSSASPSPTPTATPDVSSATPSPSPTPSATPTATPTPPDTATSSADGGASPPPAHSADPTQPSGGSGTSTGTPPEHAPTDSPR